MTIQRARSLVPALAVLALAAMFLNLPEAPNVLGCKTCSARDPYLPVVGAGYFATLLAISLLFPTFPGPWVARGGLTWSLLLAAALTFIQWPAWCVACLIGHACNVLIWLTWELAPPAANESMATTFRERICLILFAPIAVIALFSSLNLTFMAYGFKVPAVSPSGLQAGDAVPDFRTRTAAGRALAADDGAGVVLNFVSPECAFCKEQLAVLNAISLKRGQASYRIVNVSPALPAELVQRAPATEWIEDKDGKLRDQFRVFGTPTLFVLGTDRKIAQVISGVPDQLEAQLLTSLAKP